MTRNPENQQWKTSKAGKGDVGISVADDIRSSYSRSSHLETERGGVDRRVILRAQVGDRTAFDTVMAHYRPMIRAIAFRRTGDAEHAEDLTQQTMANAWVGVSSLRDPDQFGPWVRRIAANVCNTWGRNSRAPDISLDGSPSLGELSDPRSPPLETLLRRERAREIKDALAMLPDANSLALLLHVCGYYSYREIAEATGVQENTVAGRISRAKSQLRRLIVSRIEGLAPKRSQSGSASRNANSDIDNQGG